MGVEVMRFEGELKSWGLKLWGGGGGNESVGGKLDGDGGILAEN